MRDPLPRVQRGLAAALRDRRTQLSAAAFVLTALACYLYVLVGNINNYDNIVCTPEGYGTGLRSGRWMLTLLGDTVGHAMGNFNLPLFNGLLGLAFLGLACQFLWRALHLQKPWQCAVLTAITAAWPAAASAMLFSFTVHYYLFAVLLAAVAVWMADRSGWGWFVGASLTLACSIGVYQAYFPLAAALLVLRLLQQCLDSETPWKTVALRALRFVGVLAAAMVVYFLLLQLCLRLYHETLTAYRGINNMGKLNFAELPQMLVRCVRCFYLLPKTGYAFLTNSRLIRWAMWASLLLSAVSLALAWRDRDWKNGRAPAGCPAHCGKRHFHHGPGNGDAYAHDLRRRHAVLPAAHRGRRPALEARRRAPVGQPADLPVSCRCVGRVCMVLQRLLPHELLFQ